MTDGVRPTSQNSMWSAASRHIDRTLTIAEEFQIRSGPLNRSNFTSIDSFLVLRRANVVFSYLNIFKIIPSCFRFSFSVFCLVPCCVCRRTPNTVTLHIVVSADRQNVRSSSYQLQISDFFNSLITPCFRFTSL